MLHLELDPRPAGAGGGGAARRGRGGRRRRARLLPGSAAASPSFNFRCDHLRLAGEGDLLAQLDRSRRKLAADGLLERQAALPRPALPRTIGVVTARSSAACADLLAGLERRGWRGTIVWADAPVQDRRAAPAIARALTDLAAIELVEVAVVCRGGGSLSDLWAFCDEGLCRTVALLRLPVVSAVGHEVDRTLIDEVAAVSCSTPTHAAEALVGVDVRAARVELGAGARRAHRAAASAVARRAQRLAECSKAPARTLRAERGRLHQLLREVRAAAARSQAERRKLARTHALVVKRKGDAFPAAHAAAHKRLGALAAALGAHDPERTLARGYALVADADGEPVTSAARARERGELAVRFADDAVGRGSRAMEAATKTTPESYETAVARLEQIIARLDSGEAELRETLALCTEAKGLIEHCKTELDAVSGELTELQLDQLVAELEPGSPTS